MSAVEPSPRSRKLSWKRRLGLFALSFFCSPAVYLYLGFPRRALTVSLAFIALFAAIVFGPVWCFQYAAAFILLMLFFLILAVGPMIDALRLSASGRARTGAPFQRWWAYLGAALVLAIPGETTVRLRARDLVALRSFDVASQSMEPSLLLGEHMFCVMNVWQDQPIRRGDIVLFQKGGAFWVKRVIGLPGDSVELIDGFVSLNGRRLGRAEIGPWPGASHSSPGGPRRGVLYREALPDGRNYEIARSDADRHYFDNVPAATVPDDSLFVLGDNRDNSLDSRMTELGFVPISQVRGRPVAIFWSRDWVRIGMSPL